MAGGLFIYWVLTDQSPVCTAGLLVAATTNLQIRTHPVDLHMVFCSRRPNNI